MKTPEILVVTLTNGDVALFVNQTKVASREANDEGESPADIGNALGESLGIAVREVCMNPPSDADWNWSDVLELIPPSKEVPDSVKVKHWECYSTEGETRLTHQIDIKDQRESNGQVYIDVGTLEGDPDEMISVIVEVNTDPLTGLEHLPSIRVNFDGDNGAFNLYKIADDLLLVPESRVKVESFPTQINGVTETVFWIK